MVKINYSIAGLQSFSSKVIVQTYRHTQPGGLILGPLKWSVNKTRLRVVAASPYQVPKSIGPIGAKGDFALFRSQHADSSA